MRPMSWYGGSQMTPSDSVGPNRPRSIMASSCAAGCRGVSITPLGVAGRAGGVLEERQRVGLARRARASRPLRRAI